VERGAVGERWQIGSTPWALCGSWSGCAGKTAPMTMSKFQQALETLAPDSKRAVKDVFVAWSRDAALAQISRNVAGETALAVADFVNLLTSFAAALAKGNPAQESWMSACHDHKLMGRQVPKSHSPAILGRARCLEEHARSVAKASFGSLTPHEAKMHLLKHSGSLNPTGFEAFLRAAALGNQVVWATFDSDAPRADPFDRLPNTRAGICTALGLGGGMSNQTLVLLVWNHADSGSPPLHRPTVADAGAIRSIALAPMPTPSGVLPNRCSPIRMDSDPSPKSSCPRRQAGDCGFPSAWSRAKLLQDERSSFDQ